MSEIILNNATKQAVEAFVAHPGHAVCLVGPLGAGKGYLAKWIVVQVLGSIKTGVVLELDASNEGGIDTVRKLQRFLQLKQPGNSAFRRAIIIERADLLTGEAQNALLKTLEEPSEDMIFVLTAASLAGLKPTIQSRVSVLHVKALSRSEADKFFKAAAVELDKAYALSGGYAGLLYALLNDPQHELVAAVTEAKELIQAEPYQRLIKIEQLNKQKTDWELLLYALQRVLGAVMANSKPTQLPKLTKSLRVIYESEQDLKLSANRKLLLTDLMLQI